MKTDNERVPAKPTGRRYSSVADLMAREGTPQEIKEKVKDLAAETMVVLHLARLRQACGLTQEQMADKLGVTQSAVSKLESGRDDDLTLAEVKKYASITDQRIGLMFGKPLTHVESVKGHAEGIRFHLEALARIANQHDELEKDIQAFFGQAFFNILDILSKCNNKLPNAGGEFGVRVEVVKHDALPACSGTRMAIGAHQPAK